MYRKFSFLLLLIMFIFYVIVFQPKQLKFIVKHISSIIIVDQKHKLAVIRDLVFKFL
jgi:hypothetical protein